MLYTFDEANTQALSRRRTQHFEMPAHRGIYHDGWYADTTPPNPPWDNTGQPRADVVNGYRWEKRQRRCWRGGIQSPSNSSPKPPGRPWGAAVPAHSS